MEDIVGEEPHTPKARLKTQPCSWILKMSFSILFAYFLLPCTHQEGLYFAVVWEAGKGQR